MLGNYRSPSSSLQCFAVCVVSAHVSLPCMFYGRRLFWSFSKLIIFLFIFETASDRVTASRWNNQFWVLQSILYVSKVPLKCISVQILRGLCVFGGVNACWCRLRLAAVLVYCLSGWEAVDVLALRGWHLDWSERVLLMDLLRLLLLLIREEMETVIQAGRELDINAVAEKYKRGGDKTHLVSICITTLILG